MVLNVLTARVRDAPSDPWTLGPSDPVMSRLFLALNPSPMTGAGNNTYLIDGAVPTLVDAGIGASGHIDALAAALAGRPLARVIVTHGHADHASGVPALRARWPGSGRVQVRRRT